MAIRVLIADDHTVVRRGVAQILADDPEIEVISEAASGRQVLKAVQEQQYDVLLLDIAMPEGSGLEVLVGLRQMARPPHVLMLSMYPEKQYAIRALKFGADGYLTKESLPEELLAAIHTVASGGKYVNQALTEQLTLEFTGVAESTPSKTLSKREYQIVRLLAQGKSVTEIARELALSASSVSTYRVRLLKKLGLNSTSEIIRYAFQNKLVE